MPQKRRRKAKKRKVVKKKAIQANGPVDRWFRKTFSKKNLRKANNFLKKHKVISTAADLADDFGIPRAAKIGRVAKKLGYGKGKAPRAIKV